MHMTILQQAPSIFVPCHSPARPARRQPVARQGTSPDSRSAEAAARATEGRQKGDRQVGAGWGRHHRVRTGSGRWADKALKRSCRYGGSSAPPARTSREMLGMGRPCRAQREMKRGDSAPSSSLPSAKWCCLTSCPQSTRAPSRPDHALVISGSQMEVIEVDVPGEHGEERDASLGRVRSMRVARLHD
jgi:hypothetical protein